MFESAGFLASAEHPENDSSDASADVLKSTEGGSLYVHVMEDGSYIVGSPSSQLRTHTWNPRLSPFPTQTHRAPCQMPSSDSSLPMALVPRSSCQIHQGRLQALGFDSKADLLYMLENLVG